jgi:hypothetical protein
VVFWLLSWLECLDDNHGSAAAAARLVAGPCVLVGFLGIGVGCILVRLDIEQFMGAILV